MSCQLFDQALEVMLIFRIIHRAVFFDKGGIADQGVFGPFESYERVELIDQRLFVEGICVEEYIGQIKYIDILFALIAPHKLGAQHVYEQ